MRNCSEHGSVVVIQLWSFVLEPHNFEALAANMTSVHWSLSYEVKHLFMRVRIILNTWSHANDNSPRRVWSKNQNWIVDCSELRMNSWVHLEPLVHFKSVRGNKRWEVHGSVAVQPVAVWKLRLVVLAIWFDERLQVTNRIVNFFLHTVKETEIASLACVKEANGRQSWFA